ncbi:zinc finger, BED-type [Artemisia annua]|uniref:Zinc finger, BED-type n=1 Tax=Artemisia annua TaxID=35608 RepID=A0A2U1KY55_ARTAN|nr:zinc finger, BED-type [Artemisia annua]
MSAYFLNLFYFYHDLVANDDVEANDTFIEILGILFLGDYGLQNHIVTVELPIYKNKLEKFDRSMRVAKKDNLVYVRSNANLMEHNKKRNAINHEVLLGEYASEAQDWLVEGDDAYWEAVSDVLGFEDELSPLTSARTNERKVFEDDFMLRSEEKVDEEVEYKSDGVKIIEQYGQDEKSSINLMSMYEAFEVIC